MKPLHRISLLSASGLTACALAAAAVMPVQAATGQAATSSGWRTAYRHHYGAADNYSSYWAVVAPGRHDVWAFGGSNSAQSTTEHPVAVHWNGQHWRASALPGGLTDQIFAASAPSGSDVWAVSLFGQYVLHWNGTKWRVAKRWKGTGLLLGGVTALSSKNVWVFGTSGEGPGLGTWHYNGRSWTHITGVGGGIVSASAVSARNIWAIGSTAQGPNDIIAHYNGTHWRQLTASALKGRLFSSVVAISRTDVWADCVSPTAPRQGSLLKWNGTSWKMLTIPWKVSPEQLASDGHGGLWISAISGSATTTNWILHRSRSGTWTRSSIVQQPSLFGLALVPGSDRALAVGKMNTATGSDAVVLAHPSAR